jgi:sulfur-oxidizing protein SoxY
MPAAGTVVPLSRPTRPKAAFEATTVAAAQAALGASSALPGSAIRLEAPSIATATGSVTVGVSAELAGVSHLALLVHRAAFPLAALVRPDGAAGPYELTVHLERSDRVTALVQADGKWYSVSREIKVAARPW